MNTHTRELLPLNVAASGDALYCTVVCRGVGNHFITLIHEGWLSRAQERSGNVCPTSRECDPTRTRPWLWLLPATAYLACRCQILATAVAKHSVVGSRHRNSNVARTNSKKNLKRERCYQNKTSTVSISKQHIRCLKCLESVWNNFLQRYQHQQWMIGILPNTI